MPASFHYRTRSIRLRSVARAKVHCVGQRAALFCGTMTKTQTTIGAGTKIVGSVETDGDLVVDGQLEGGPLRVAGRLLVGRTGAVSCEDTEVADALVLGVFSGTLKARDVVRIHQAGRLLGEVMATRVTFVSDAQLQGLLGTAANAPAPAKAATPSPSAPKAPPLRAASATTPAPVAGTAPPPLAPPAPAPIAMPHAAPPPAPPVAAPRTIPALPSIGSRSMQRRD